MEDSRNDTIEAAIGCKEIVKGRLKIPVTTQKKPLQDAKRNSKRAKEDSKNDTIQAVIGCKEKCMKRGCNKN